MPLPQSWREDGCITGDKKGWRRPTKSSSLTPHVHISLQGGLKAPVALFHLLKWGEGAALAGRVQGGPSGYGEWERKQQEPFAQERRARISHLLHTPARGPACQVDSLMCLCFHPALGWAGRSPLWSRGTAGGGSVPSCRLSVIVCGMTSGSEQGLQRRCCLGNQGKLL